MLAPITKTTLLHLLLFFPILGLSLDLSNILQVKQDSVITTDTIYDPAGNFSIFVYGNYGNLKAVTDKKGHTTRYEYDDKNRLIAEYFPNYTSQRYEYGPNERLSLSVDAYGDSTLFYYNVNNQLVKKDLPGEAFVAFGYNDRGQLATARNNESYITYSYDALGRLSNVDQNGQLINYLYNDPKGRRLITYPSGREVEETIDSLGRALSVRDGETVDLLPDLTDAIFIDSIQKVGLLATFEYDGLHRPIGRVLGNNTTMQLAYDEENRIKGIIHQPNNIAAYNSIYDEAGNKVLEENIYQPELSKSYKYDTLNRLSSFSQGDPRWKKPSSKVDFNYDAEGNRKSMLKNNNIFTYETNKHNGYKQVTKDGKALNLEYDKQQNLLFDGNFHYLFDVERRLKMVFGNSAFPYADLQASYNYDALGRIIEVRRGKELRRFFYDENRLIEEQNGEGQVLATYIYEPNSTKLVSMRSNGNDYFYHYDLEGSVIALSDKNGTVVERYTYDINGKLKVETEFAELLYSRIGNPFTFGGMWLDERTGLYQHRSSFYNSEIGRRMTKDAANFLETDALQPYPIPSSLSYTDTRALFPARRRLGLGSTEEKVLVIWASLAARGNAHSFNNGRDLMERLEMESTKCGCLEETVVVSHGWGWPITKGQKVNGGVYGTVWINGFLGDIPPGRKGEGFKITKSARELKDLEVAIRQQRVNFCSSCSIILTGCRVASTGNFVTRLAKMTGCTVLASHGGCSGYTAPLFTSGPKTTKEKNAGEFKGFSLTYPDGRRDLLQELLRLW